MRYVIVNPSSVRNIAHRQSHKIRKENALMLRWAVIFFLIAIAAAVFGFGGIAGLSADIAWLLFIGFLILAVVSVFFGRRGLLR